MTTTTTKPSKSRTGLLSMVLPRFEQLHKYAGKNGYCFYLALFLGLGVFALQVTAGNQLQGFVDSAVHNPTSRLEMVRALALFWLYNNFALPGVQGLISVLLSQYYATIVANLTNRVYERIQKIRIQDLKIRGMETLLTTQINSIWDGMKNGQRVLILNIGKLLGALVVIWRVYGTSTGLIVVVLLIVLVVVLNQTLGRRQYRRLSSALSIRSLTERLLRHYVRPRGLFYHWRHRDLSAKKMRREHVAKRSKEAVQADVWSEIYQFTGISTLSLLILSSAVFVIISAASFTTLLSSIVLLVTQGETFVSALDALTKGVAESQSIEVGARRLEDDIFSIPLMQQMSSGEIERLLQGPLTVRLAAVECEDIYTHQRVLHDVNLDFHSGEIVVLHGGHKAGKTEIVDAISGVILPVLGDVFFNGKSTGLLPFFTYGVFPKKVFNLDETLGNSIGMFSILQESIQKKTQSLQLELQKLQRLRRQSPTLIARIQTLQQEMQLLQGEQRKLRRLRGLADGMMRSLGIDKAIKGLPQGYNTPMHDVVSYFSEDHKWALAFVRSLLMPVAAEGKLPRLMILDQSLDELNDSDFVKRVLMVLHRLAQTGMLVLITSSEPDELKSYGLATRWINLGQFSGDTVQSMPDPSTFITLPQTPVPRSPKKPDIDTRITRPMPGLDPAKINTRPL